VSSTSSDSSIRIMAVGDIMLGMAYPQSLASKNNIPKKLKEDQSSIISEEVKKLFKESDIVFGNLECVVSNDFNNYNENSIIDYPSLVMAPLEGMNLLRENFTHLNTVNNHILDHGKDKAKETLKYLEKNQIQNIGNPIKEKNELQTVSIKNRKIGFLGYNLCIDNRDELVEKILADIEKKKREVDFLIVSLHWGWSFEQLTDPAPTQIEFGRKVIDRGADVILGHHSHVFQPVEIYKDKIIAYSLGNFIFDMWSEKNLKSGILDLTITKEDEISVDIIPIHQNDFEVRTDKDDDQIKDMIKEDMNIQIEMEEYLKRKKKVKRKHYKEFFRQYLSNSHKLPLGYHYYLWSNWFSKLF